MVLNNQAHNQILEESKQQDEGAKIVNSSENVKALVLSEGNDSSYLLQRNQDHSK